MKTNKILSIALALASLFFVQSCLFEQEDFFDKESAARMTSVLEEARNVLTSSEKGWVMELFPESEQSYGGYVFTLKFSKDTVTVQTELDSDYTNEISSLYSLIAESGPVLSFNVYNDYLHFFSTPSATAYQAYGGEFQFMIMELTDAKVTLKGTRTGNIAYLYRLEETPDEYISKIVATEESILMTGLKTSIAGLDVNGEIDTDNRQIKFYISDPAKVGTKDENGDEYLPEIQYASYVLKNKAMRFYKPIKVSDKEMCNFVINDDGSVTCTDEGATDIKFESVFPEGWRPYSAYAGNYEFQYQNYYSSKYNVVTIPVTLTPTEDKTGFIMSGVSATEGLYTFRLAYKKSKGCLELNSQKIGEYGGSDVWICAWCLGGGGSLTWSTSAGVDTFWDGNEEHPSYSWVDCGGYSGNSVDSFIMWQIKNGASVGQFVNSEWYFKGAQGGNSCRMYYIVKCKMTKVD